MTPTQQAERLMMLPSDQDASGRTVDETELAYVTDALRSGTLRTTETIAAKISERTKAIIVTHLFGNPCVMEPIMALAKEKGIPVIEDSAQTFLAKCGDTFAGTIGDIGCFSLQQGKHMTTGEGGMVVTNDEKIARHMFLYINKAWGYGDANADHYFMALNYRISELQAAVALGQLEKLEESVANRRRTATMITELRAGIDG